MIYRPISLCNFSYKFILKVMANRLRLVSPKLVSPLKVHLFQIIHDNIFFLTYGLGGWSSTSQHHLSKLLLMVDMIFFSTKMRY